MVLENTQHLYENTANYLAFNFIIIDKKISKIENIKLKLKRFKINFSKN